MRVFSLPADTRALLFDLDSTLYTDAAYAAFQEAILVERLARERAESLEETRALLSRMRAEREEAGMGRTSLGRLFVALGIDVETSVRWRRELIEPRDWLAPDPRLDAVLAELAGRYALALVTNNPRIVGEKSLESLGVRSRFRAVVGLDDTMVSKPAPEPFLMAVVLLGAMPERCVSVGDRYDVDLAPALALGMGGILVEDVEDVYELSALLAG